jgi:CheY-like chemotaxis protein/predicted kinase
MPTKKMLVLVGGHPFSGRAALAEGVADSIGAPPPIRYERTARGSTIKDRYRALAARVQKLLRSNHAVVAVAPFSRAERRAELAAVAAHAAADLIYVERTCAEATMRSRIARQFASAAPSFLELRLARALGQRAGYAAPGAELDGAHIIRVADDSPIEQLVDDVARQLGTQAAHCNRTRCRTPKVLLIDDDLDFSFTLREMLEQAGCDVVVANGGAEALAWADQSSTAPDVVLLDYSMPDWTGLDLAPPLRERWPDAEIVLLTAYDEPWLCDEAFREKIDEYLCKPVRAADVLRLLEDL